MLGGWIGYIYGLKIGTNDGRELGFSDGKLLVRAIGAVDGISLGTYDGTVLRSLEGSTKGISEGNFEVLLIGSWLGYLNGLELRTFYGNSLLLLYGKPLDTTLRALYGLPPGTYGGT